MTTSEDPLDLAAIQARADAATSGPWRFGDLGGVRWTVWQQGVVPFDSTVMRADSRDDAEFIVAAREDIPALLARVRALVEERDDLQRAWEDEQAGWHAANSKALAARDATIRAAEAKLAQVRDRVGLRSLGYTALAEEIDAILAQPDDEATFAGQPYSCADLGHEGPPCSEPEAHR